MHYTLFSDYQALFLAHCGMHVGWIALLLAIIRLKRSSYDKALLYGLTFLVVVALWLLAITGIPATVELQVASFIQAAFACTASALLLLMLSHYLFRAARTNLERKVSAKLSELEPRARTQLEREVIRAIDPTLLRYSSLLELERRLTVVIREQ